MAINNVAGISGVHELIAVFPVAGMNHPATYLQVEALSGNDQPP